MKLSTLFAHLLSFSISHLACFNQKPLLATRVLTVLCGITNQEKGSAPTSIVSYLSSDPEKLRIVFMNRLRDSTENKELRIAILKLIIKSLECQPGLAQLFIDVRNDLENGSLKDSCLDVILNHFMQRPESTQTMPQLWENGLLLLKTFWMEAPDFNAILTPLRETKNFWVNLLSPTESEKEAILFGTAHASSLIRSRSSQYMIVSYEVFYTQNGPLDPNLEAVLAQLNDTDSFVTRVRLYSKIHTSKQMLDTLLGQYELHDLFAQARFKNSTNEGISIR